MKKTVSCKNRGSAFDNDRNRIGELLHDLILIDSDYLTWIYKKAKKWGENA